MRIKMKLMAGILGVGLATTCLAQRITEMPVVLQLPNMEKVEIQKAIYKSIGDTTLRLDIYYPPDFDKKSNQPVVIFNNGVGALQIPDWRVYQDWAKLVAVSGMIAINYQSRFGRAMEDSEDLIAYVRSHAEELKVDANRMGLWTCSGNVTVGLPLIMQQDRDYIRCAVIYYGSANVKLARQDIPLFIVRAGLDGYQLNKNMERLVADALSADLSFELVNYLEGQHAFDILDDNERSREIIQQTLAFLKTNLAKADSDEPRFVLTAGNFYSMVAAGDVERAKQLFRAAVQKYRADKSFNRFYNRATAESSLNQIGYQLLQEKKMTEALEVFKLAIETYPESPNVYDSIAEAYEANGQAKLALENAEKAITLLDQAQNLNANQRHSIRESAMEKIERLKK